MFLSVWSQVQTTVELHPRECIAVLTIVWVLYTLVVFPLFISPLRHVPGPYLNRVSVIPRIWAQATFQWVRRVHRLHQQYGDVVVVAPNEISFNGSRYVGDFYTKNMPKSAYYANFKLYGHDNLFSTLDNDAHLSHKKVLRTSYSKSSLACNSATKNIIISQVRRLVSQVEKTSVRALDPDWLNATSAANSHGKGHNLDGQWLQPRKKNMGIDVYSLFGAMSMDAVTAFELGDQNGTNMLEHPDQRTALVQYREQAECVFWTSVLPAKLPLLVNSAPELAIENWLINLFDNINLDRIANSTMANLFRSGYRGLSAYSFISDNIIAGHETTAFSLTYVCYELSRPVHNHRQSALRAELRNAFGQPRSDADVLDDLRQIDRLPYLDAVLQENFRVHTSGPGFLPRSTPETYEVDIANRKVAIPPGTVVSCQQHSLHRIPEIFPSPDLWIPERWLQNKGEQDAHYKRRIAKMNKHIMSFGKGVRMCLGMNFALTEIKCALANLYWRYESSICSDWCDVTQYDSGVKNGKPINLVSGKPPSTTDEAMMSMIDSVSTRPCYDECWLEWKNPGF